MLYVTYPGETERVREGRQSLSCEYEWIAKSAPRRFGNEAFL